MISTRKRPWLLGAPLIPVLTNVFEPSIALRQRSWGGSTPSANAGDLASLVVGNTAFALDLYAELRQEFEGNLLFSPYSISLALAMTYAGARGETATQIAEALRFSLDQSQLHHSFAMVNNDLTERGNAEDDPSNMVTARALRIASALWGEQTYPFSADIAEHYDAGLQKTDFINAPEAAREEINAWVAEQTDDRIQDIVGEGDVTSDMRLVLANAIAFHAAWYLQFSTRDTSDDTFHLLDGTTVTVPFMFQHAHFDYARGEGFQAIELPYAGSGSNPGDFAFTILLPDKREFASFEQGLNVAVLTAAIRQLEWTEALIHLPKFAFTFDAGLSAPLQALGMVDAFDPGGADFTGMLDGTLPPALWLDDLLHSAYIGVDEDGTEAGTATVVLGPGAPPPMEEPPEVHCNRPFLFAIRDTVTDTVLFLGRVMDPRG